MNCCAEVRGFWNATSTPDERGILAQIVERIRAKDDLDFQQARQGVLKGWLFVHIPLTYSMLLAGMVHGILAWRLS